MQPQSCCLQLAQGTFKSKSKALRSAFNCRGIDVVYMRVKQAFVSQFGIVVSEDQSHKAKLRSTI